MAIEINFKRIIADDLDSVIIRTTNALKTAGFGVLTRIDLDQKIEEKIGKKIPRTVILGVCNPHLAYETYMVNTDVASLLPCNVVIRDLGSNNVSVEIAKPTALMTIFGDSNLELSAVGADAILAEALKKI